MKYLFIIFYINLDNVSRCLSDSQRCKVPAQKNAQISNPLPSLPPTNDRNASNDLISPLPSDVTSSPTKSDLVRQRTKDKSKNRKSLLNTYSSEELLLQAASSLQGLEGNEMVANFIFAILHRTNF